MIDTLSHDIDVTIDDYIDSVVYNDSELYRMYNSNFVHDYFVDVQKVVNSFIDSYKKSYPDDYANMSKTYLFNRQKELLANIRLEQEYIQSIYLSSREGNVWQKSIYNSLIGLSNDKIKLYNRELGNIKYRLYEFRYNKTLNNNSITKDDIEKAKLVPIENFITDYRISSGRLYCKCLFHDEKTGSMCIYQSTNTYHCFGCNASGNVINIIMKLMNLSFYNAVKYLINK